MNDNKQKCYKQPQESQEHASKNESFAIQIITVTIYTLHYAFQKYLNNFKIWISSPLSYINDASSHFYFTFFNRCKKLARKEASSRCTTCLCIVVI